MPKMSVIIPVYNTEQFLVEALESVKNQTLDDIEAIIVDDGSTDGSAGIIARYVADDNRFKALRQDNSGLHLARKTGVEAAGGEYALFLDSDDSLEPDACEKLYRRMAADPVDILHFGVTVNALADADAKAARGFEDFANRDIGRLAGKEIRWAIFPEAGGYRLDWRTWQRVFPLEFLKRAYDLMDDRRLERAEDSHEGLVLACLAQTFDSMDGFRGYRYRYGSGVSTGGTLDEAAFGKSCAQFRACLDASIAFERNHPDLVEHECIQGLKSKLLEILANDWQARVNDGGKEQAFLCFAREFGGANAKRELYRFIRDNAYRALQENRDISEEPFVGICRKLADVIGESESNDEDRLRCADMRAAAMGHLRELAQRERFREYDRQRTRIFVTTHGYFATPDSPLFQPVQVGPGQFSPQGRFTDAYHDGDGDNIARMNPRYCEMTVQYWAWKNVDADRYGFCHYRRYFNLSDTPANENAWGEVEEEVIDEKTCRRYGLDAESLEACMGDADVLITERKDVSRFPDRNRSVYEQYCNGEFLHQRDLDTLIEVIADLQPDYLDDAAAYLAGSISCFCNMYVMKRDAFFAYCEWLFPLLEEYEARADMSRYSQQEQRVTGHLAERLFNIYLWHNQRSATPWKLKEVQCVRFANPTSVAPMSRAFAGAAIPVVFAADNNYSPMLATAIYSLAKNSNPNRKYDIVVLSRGIDDRNQRLMREAISAYPNVSLRFFGVSRLVAGYDLTVNEHITEETYYRFLIQWILPDYPKVLYLDSDLIIHDDVARLYDTELGNDLLAAVVDVDWAGNCNKPHSTERIDYAHAALGMRDPYAYFQAGVLLLNTVEMSKLHTLDEWLGLAAIPHIYNDQDVLNAECEGRVRYLDLAWNVLVDTGRVEIALKHAPVEMFQAYLDSRHQPHIIHYAGAIKPWNIPTCDFAEIFWSYARETPFYETLLARLARQGTSEELVTWHDEFLFEQGSRSFVRKVADVVVPYGSGRREALRRLVGRAE